MDRVTRRAAWAGLIATGAAATAAAVFAQPRFRMHDATEAEPLRLARASAHAGRNQVSIAVRGGTRVITSNGIPDHAVGQFPNRGNPNRIRAQRYRFEMPAAPAQAVRASDVRMGLFGVAVNGVPFDPGAAEFWQGDPRSGWQYEALGGAVPLGLDANFGHVQPTGAYHYHGLPIGLMQQVGWSGSTASPLIGYAADGFPIYAVTAKMGGQVVEMTSSYRLRGGARPGGSHPNGRYDGTFVQDYVYVPGAGRLDAANGAFVKTADYPGGTYAYFLTRAFPVIPRQFAGRPDASFLKRRG